MSGSVTLTIDLFGAFRGLNMEGPVRLTVPQGTSLAQIKQQIGHAVGNAKLVNVSALANERQVLPRDYVATEDARLVILPPVSGG